MRSVILLFCLLLPMVGVTAPICPAGYVLNDIGMCEEKWQITTGKCPEGSYYNRKLKNCTPRCPYRSVDEISDLGDRVCQKDGKREWLDEYTRKCMAKGMQYLPQIHMCLVPDKRQREEKELTDCPTGKVWRLQNGQFSCVKGNPQKVIEQLKERLVTKGLKYIEYLEAIKDIQTNRFAAEMMQYRWEEATGIRQTKEQKEAAIMAATKCPDEYIATPEGGCKPEKSCSVYGCPDGQVSELAWQGKNQFCRCRPISP